MSSIRWRRARAGARHSRPSVDSLCFYIEEEGVLFSGDTLLGSSTTTVGDLATTEVARSLWHCQPKVICPVTAKS